MRDKTRRLGGLLLLGMLIFGLLAGCGAPQREKDYGVFLGIDASEAERLDGYALAVIDAQQFSAQDIAALHEKGTKVYTYLNVGSVEDFRDYYAQYAGLALGDYENWSEEKWVDVSSPAWQSFIAGLARQLDEKGVDGFFIDNCDVYYQFPEEKIFDGLTTILKDLMTLQKAVVINGGDAYVSQYRAACGNLGAIMTGVNQETVFSSIDFAASAFGKQTEEERGYFAAYVEGCKADGLDVYLLEYTKDPALMREIARYCRAQGFSYYISDSIELE